MGAKMMPKSIDYQPSLIERLKNPDYAIAFITAILAEPDPEPELLHSALVDVATALGSNCMTPAQLHQHQERLTQLLAQPTSQSLLPLSHWLNQLGLQLTLVPAQSVEPNPTQGMTSSTLAG
jgi:DNA-binding phage protein